MNAFFKASAIAAATASIATAAPASAATFLSPQFAAPGTQTYEHSRERYSHDDWRRGYRPTYRPTYRSAYRYDQPVYRDSRVWRGRDGRTYCRRQDGTTGLLIGGAAGALIGNQIDGGHERVLGTVLGAVGGALLGREIDRGGSRCR